MPGLVGFVGSYSPEQAMQLIASMAKALHPGDGYKVDLYYDENIGLGKVGLGITDPGPQPIWNEDQSLCLLMEGEIFDCGEWKQRLIAKGHQFHSDCDAEFVLHLFEELGENFAVKLNGAFIVTIWDRISNQLIIVNDRFGLRPLYYSEFQGGLIFASGVRALFAVKDLDREIDRLAIAQLLAFDFALGDRTLLSKTKLLPPASYMIHSEGKNLVHSYWKLEFGSIGPTRKEQEYVEGLIFHLRQAVNRQAPGTLPVGVLLSGGLDSRMIAALLFEQKANNALYTFTFGIPNCDDDRLARKVAKALVTDHRFYKLQPGFLPSLSKDGIMLTDGLMNCLAMVAYANLGPQAELVRVIYKGYMGDALLGSHLRREFWVDHDEESLCQTLFNLACAIFSPIEQKALFTEDFQKSLGHGVHESFCHVLAESGAALVADIQNHFDIRQRQRRYILNGVELVRSRVIVRTPFCDNDLFEFMLSVPPGFRLDRHLLVSAFIREFPFLANIPVTPSGLPMKLCLQDIQIRLNRLIRWHLYSMGLTNSPPVPFKPYTNYAYWMRTVLRSWIEELLLNDRTLERGYFNPDYLHQLVSDHMAGIDNNRKLGMLITIELWHRLFID